MRIGIDIDGVLTDCERFLLDYGTKYCVENNYPININKGKYNEKEAFNWTDEQELGFWNEYLAFYAMEYPVRCFASEVINKLKEKGHEIYIITARNEYGLSEEYYGRMKELVEKWLKVNKIEYDRIIYTEGSKLPYCVGNYIDIMIEDSPTNIKEISTKVPVLCFNSTYNESIEENDNITRVFSWYDVLEKLAKY